MVYIFIMLLCLFSCRKIPKEFHLDYHMLEDRPALPQSLSGGSGGAGGTTNGQQQ